MEAPVSFVCNICDTACLAPAESLTREAPTCATCGSSVRTRAIVHLLSLGLFGRSLALRDFPHDRGIRGIGLSDWEGYAAPLAERLDYTNTHFHQEPRLDITQVPESMQAGADFVIAADVFQHVLGPVSRGFDGLRRLLRPRGVLVMTVPYDPAAATVEHFPGLAQVDLREEGGRRRLHQRHADGTEQVHDALVFHGGQGFTLELRRYGLRDLLRELADAGFDAAVHGEPVPERGIAWAPWSRPILARLRA